MAPGVTAHEGIKLLVVHPGPIHVFILGSSSVGPLVDPLMHLVQPLEEMIGPVGGWSSNPDHVVTRMLALALAAAAQIKVWADGTLVPIALDWALASITHHIRVDLLILMLSLGILISNLSSADSGSNLHEKII